MPRSQEAIRQRLRKTHGLYPTAARSDALSPAQVAHIFGVHPRTVLIWIRRELLGADRAPTPRAQCYITPSHLRQFLYVGRAHYDWQQMPPGPWRNEAEVLWRCDPWLTVGAAAAALGLACSTITKRLRNRGLYAQCIRRPNGYWLPRAVVLAIRDTPLGASRLPTECSDCGCSLAASPRSRTARCGPCADRWYRHRRKERAA